MCILCPYKNNNGLLSEHVKSYVQKYQIGVCIKHVKFYDLGKHWVCYVLHPIFS